MGVAKSQIRTVALGILATLVVLVGVELLARVAGSLKTDVERSLANGQEAWLRYSASLGWERKPGFDGEIAGVRRTFDASGLNAIDSGQVEPDTKRKRVLFFGDSNTFGFGVTAEQSYPEQVERRLPSVAAINLAVIGYSSYQGELAVRDYVGALKPDAIVVSFNFNDRRYVRSLDSSDGPSAFRKGAAAQGAMATTIRWLDYSHAYRALRTLLQAVRLIPDSGSRIDVGSLVPRVDEAAYRNNLARIAETAKQTGIPLLFVVLNDNPLQSDHLNRGIAALQEGDLERSIAALNSAATSHKMFSNLARVYLAQALIRTGEPAKAAATLNRGEVYLSFSGGTVVRRDSSYNDIMRQVAASVGATLVEAGMELDRYPSVYFDYCHFDARGHEIVADLIAPALQQILGLDRRER